MSHRIEEPIFQLLGTFARPRNTEHGQPAIRPRDLESIAAKSMFALAMTTHTEGAVRLPAVAGTFYPASKAALDAQLERYLGDAARARTARGASPYAIASPKALIAPHAGYIYSGPIAASAWVELLPVADRITRVVVLGPAHRVHVEGIVAPGTMRLRTPLGDLDIDDESLSRAGIPASPAVHEHEHSVEVQLPFLQKIVPRAKVVPLAVGRGRTSEVARVLRALWGGPETAIVVSSDLSHYLPYRVGREIDTRTASRIVDLDRTPLRGDEACGAAAINGLLAVARDADLRAELLDLRSSGDTAGSLAEVVGYGAFAFRARDGS